MKKAILLVVFMMLFALQLFSQITFQKYYNAASLASTTIQTSDGGYAIVYSNGSSSTTPVLIKTNANGDTLWTKRLGAPALLNDGNSLLQTQDGGYLVCGGSIIKTNSNGVPLWSKKLLNNLFFNSMQAVELPNGDLVVVGKSMQTSGMDISFVRLDNMGNQIFAKTIGGGDQDEVLCIKATNTGGFIIGGQTHQQNGVNLKGFLINTDGSGNILWSKTYDTPANELFYSVYALSDGGFAAIGVSSLTSSVNEKMIVVKVNSTGALVWSKTYQDAVTYGFDIYETPNHRLMLAGTTKHTSAYSGLLVNTDSAGTVLWRKEYTPSGSAFATRFNTLRRTSDGGYILGGLDFPISGGGKCYLLKTDSNGDNFNNCFQSTVPMTAISITPTVANYTLTTISDISSTVTNTHSCFCDTVSTICTSVGLTPDPMQSIWSIYPNPFSNLINIVSSTFETADLSIYDINAKKIFQKSFSGNISISMETFSSGLYFYEFKNESGVVSKGKLMKN